MCKAPEIYNLSFISPNYRDECDLLHYQTGFPWQQEQDSHQQ
jgi:hypothetical protein